MRQACQLDFFATIKKKVENFQWSGHQKGQVQGKRNSAETRYRDLFGHTIVVIQSRKLDTKQALNHPLDRIPSTLANGQASR